MSVFLVEALMEANVQNMKLDLDCKAKAERIATLERERASLIAAIRAYLRDLDETGHGSCTPLRHIIERLSASGKGAV